MNYRRPVARASDLSAVALAKTEAPRGRVDGGVSLPLCAALAIIAIALVTVLLTILAEPPGCPAGSYDGYRAVGCYRSLR